MTKGAQMDEASRAMCYALRNPGRNGKPMQFKDIQKMVHHEHYYSSQGFFLWVLWAGSWNDWQFVEVFGLVPWDDFKILISEL